MYSEPTLDRQEEAAQPANASSLVSKAHAWNMKIWSVAKLESVLDRCDVPAVPSDRRASRNAPAAGGRSLMSLVEQERLYGTIDGSARNPDMHFFSRDSCFVLVEDMTSQLATIHAAEYTCKWTRDGVQGGTWPKLYAHPEVRNPFTEPNEREFRRWKRDLEQDKQKKDEHEREQLKALERERRRVAEAERLQQAQQAGDLRRSVSMVNLRKRAISNASEFVQGESIFDTPEMLESANASGYLRSQYAAASGNSVTITSTTGTTTSAGNSLLRSAQLPAALRGKEVSTSMKVNGRTKSMMGPPPDLPQKALRKSKSTTTMRLPKREEGAKPGYCENCRKKYDDFETVSLFIHAFVTRSLSASSISSPGGTSTLRRTIGTSRRWIWSWRGSHGLCDRNTWRSTSGVRNTCTTTKRIQRRLARLMSIVSFAHQVIPSPTTSLNHNPTSSRVTVMTMMNRTALTYKFRWRLDVAVDAFYSSIMQTCYDLYAEQEFMQVSLLWAANVGDLVAFSSSQCILYHTHPCHLSRIDWNIIARIS